MYSSTPLSGVKATGLIGLLSVGLTVGLLIGQLVGLLGCGNSEPSGSFAGDVALALLKEGQIEPALAELRDRDPGPHQNPPAWAIPISGELLRLRAFGSADSLMHQWPTSSWSEELRYFAANLAVVQGRFAEAETLYREMEGEGPRGAAMKHELATLYRLQGRHAEAASAALAGLVLDPGRQALRLLLAKSLIDDGRPDEALLIARDMPTSAARLQAEGEAFLAADEADSAMIRLDYALRLSPQLPEVRYLLGRALLLQGNADRALKAFHSLAEATPPYRDSPFWLAETLEAVGDLPLAAEVRSDWEALAAQRDLAEIRARGLRYSQAGSDGLALASFDSAIAKAPARSEFHNDRGAALARLGRIDEAIAAFERALDLEDNPAARANLERLRYDAASRQASPN